MSISCNSAREGFDKAYLPNLKTLGCIKAITESDKSNVESLGCSIWAD